MFHHLTKVLSCTALAASVTMASAATKETPAPRVWQVPDPLFQPLLGNEPPGLAREGVLMWKHNMANPNLLRQAARRFGLRYVLSEMYQQAGQEQLRLFGPPPNSNDEGYAYRKKYNVKYAYMLKRGGPWEIDPKAVDKSIQDLDRELTRSGDAMWAISASDEVIKAARGQGAKLMENPPKNYAYIHQADQEVRDQFGGGKWGIPHGNSDTNPYRWIAYNKWLNVKFHERAERIRAVIQNHNIDSGLDIPVVSSDPPDYAAEGNYSDKANDFDIFTQQALPRDNRWAARAGFLTKYLTDLTGKEVWPLVHVQNYVLSTTPREVRELLSQVFRNGGSGFDFYLADVAGARKVVGNTIVGNMQLCYFGSPRRYNTILNIINLTRTMPKLRYPDTRTAILYNDDVLQSVLRNKSTPWESTEACYTFLGPVARSWFKFIDDTKVLSSPSLNTQFDTIYVPSATYQRPEIVAKLKSFVQNGGTLVCSDASAFETDTIGNDTHDQRQQIFGVTMGKTISPKVLSVRLKTKSYTLPAELSAVAFTPDKDTQVLGTFDDGSAAITVHPLGRGKAILFAANFFNPDLVQDSKWRDFYTDWAAYLGAPVNLDIWRFQFPDSVLGKDIPVPAGQCLTDNHVTWREEKAITTGNIKLDGKYQLQPAPDAMADIAGDQDGWIPFANGHLTDRRQSMLDPIIKPEVKSIWNQKYQNPDSRWMVSWENPAPVTLTFDLQKPVRPGALKLWFDDTLPTFDVQGSNDLQHWQALGKNSQTEQAGADVKDIEIALHTNAPYRYVRVVFTAREKGQKLSLVESELWGTIGNK